MIKSIYKIKREKKMLKKGLTALMAGTIIVAGLTGCGEEKSEERLKVEASLKEKGIEISEENVQKALQEAQEAKIAAIKSSARSSVGAMRSAIATERQKRILKGDFNDINANEVEGLLDNGLDSHWSIDGNNFTFTLNDETCVFTLSNNRLEKSSCSIYELNDL